jgi:hypothetical protein
MKPLVICALVASAAGLSAADPSNGFHDIRVGYSLVEKGYDATIDNGINDEDVDQAWDSNHRAFLMYLGSFGGTPLGGLAFGADLVANGRDLDNDDSSAELEYQSYGAHVYLGWAMPIGKVFQLELLPFFGAASAELERTLPGGISTSDNQTTLEFGADLNAIATLGRFQIGAQVGYLIEDTRFNLNNGVDDREYDFSNGSFLGSVMLGYRIF